VNGSRFYLAAFDEADVPYVQVYDIEKPSGGNFR
jgi:hypothetical protein